MKVLIVVRTLKIGGMERVAVNLADAFAEQGHESHLMYFKPRPPQLAPNNEQVNVHHFALSHAMWASGVGGGIEIAARLFNSVLRKSYFYCRAGGVGSFSVVKYAALSANMALLTESFSAVLVHLKRCGLSRTPALVMCWKISSNPLQVMLAGWSD